MLEDIEDLSGQFWGSIIKEFEERDEWMSFVNSKYDRWSKLAKLMRENEKVNLR